MYHWFYILIFILIIVLAFKELNDGISEKDKTNYYVFIGVILVLMVGFRSFQGADTPAYYGLYLAFKDQPFLTSHIFDDIIEPGYIWICQISGYFGFTFLGVLVTIAIVSISSKMRFIKEFSPYIFLSLAIYYTNIFGEFNQIRQIMAVGICLLGFKYVIQRKFIYFIIYVYIAYLFHKSAFIFVIVYFIAPLNISTLGAILLIVLSIALIPFKLYQYFSFFEDVSGAEEVVELYNRYYGSKYAGGEMGFSIVGDVYKACVYILFFSFEKYALKENKNFKYFRNIFLLGIMISYMFRGNEMFATRLPGYYLFLIVIAFPMLIYYLPTKTKKNVFILLVVLQVAYFIRAGSIGYKQNFDDLENVIINLKNPYE